MGVVTRRPAVSFFRWQTALALVLAIAAFLVVTQIRNELLIRRHLGVPSLRLEEVAVTFRRQERQRAGLERELGRLRDRLQTYAHAAAQSEAELTALQRQLHELELHSGLRPLVGPGVVVDLDDSPRPLRPGETPNEVILHNYDIVAIVNELWAAGAEAVAINGQRMIPTTPIRSVATTMMVNTKRIAPPIRIQAIGDPAQLAAYLQRPESYLGLLKAFAFPASVARADRIVIPAYGGPLRFRYLRPPDAPR